MFVITGATGNTGKIIATRLLEAGKSVKLIGRDPEKANDLITKGAEFAKGSLDDVEFLTTAFEGAAAVYAMIPPAYREPDFYGFQTKTVDTLATAIKNSGVKYAVSLSSLGAQLSEDTGVVFGLHYMEEEFNKIEGLNVLHLRPTFFMENLFGQIPLIKESGIMGSPVLANIKMPMIATVDIGNYGAERILKLDFTGKSAQYLLGERDLTYPEIASILGKAIGKPNLSYIEFPFEGMIASMVQMGVGESMANRMALFLQVANTGRITEGVIRDAESTTPTSIEEFAKTFAYVYNS
ncbi:MAG: NmrA family NAD(P)-binding protein [Ignavibacteria bacterium]|nr:NmrA family NAD(P)-binding protein [Ignavibacteria bacterium]